MGRVRPLLVAFFTFVAACTGDSDPMSAPLPSPPSTPPELISRIELGALPGDIESQPNGINDHGEVVGASFAVGGGVRAFFWSPSAGMIDLGDGGASDINDLGDIVGGSGEGRAAVWERLGASWNFLELPPFEEPILSERHNDGVQAINDAATLAVGQSSPDMGKTANGFPIICQIPVLWEKAGRWSDAVVHLLPTSGDGQCQGHGSGVAFDVNDDGSIVGLSPSLTFPQRAVVWTGSPGNYVMETLPPEGVAESYALAINDRGVIAGFLGDDVFGQGDRVAVVWTPTDSGWRIDSLGSDDAVALNDAGVVVGEVSESRQEAWFWTEVGGRVSLGPWAAGDINNRNEVIGIDGRFRAVLWTLTPP